MESEDPTKVTGPRRYSFIGIVLSIVGIVLPICILLGIYPFVEHGRAVTDQEVMLASLCSVIYLTLELIAIVYGLAARRTAPGKVAVGMSGIQLALAILLFAFVLTIVLDRGFGWANTPFWLIIVCVLLAISLLLLGLFRAKWLN
jgi:hypothetical protein